jgi:hypothetical protein
MWISWIGGIVLLLSNRFYKFMGAVIKITGKDLAIQIAGPIDLLPWRFFV